MTLSSDGRRLVCLSWGGGGACWSLMGLNGGQEAATPLAKSRIESISRQITAYISSVSDNNTDKTLRCKDKATLAGSEASGMKRSKHKSK